MSNLNLTIIIQALDQASVVINQMAQQTGQHMKQMQQSSQGTAKAFSALSQAATIASGIIIRDLANSFSRAVTESMELGGQFESLNSSFVNVIGNIEDADLSLEDLRGATRGTVADVDLLRAANTALALGLPVNELDELFAAAMKLGRAMGIDTLSAVNSLTIGIGRQSRLVLDNLGIVFQAEDAYKWYAESVGKASNQLSESERRLAWQSYAIEQVKVKAEELGDVQDGVTTGQEQWNAAIKNLETSIGQALGPLALLVGAVREFLPIATTTAAIVIPQWVNANNGLKNSLSLIGAQIATIPTHIRNLTTSITNMNIGWKAAGIAIGTFLASFTLVFFILQQVPPEMRQMVGAIVAITAALAAAAIAAVVFWTSVSLTTALPAIMAAIGVAVAGVTVALSDAGVAAGELAEETDKATTATEKLKQEMDTLIEAENQLYEESIANLKASWEEKLNIEKSGYDEIEDMINQHYDDQLADTKSYYDELIAETEIALDEIKNARKEDLDDLELNYLLQKQATLAAYESGKIDKATYEAEIDRIETEYRDTRSRKSDEWRIQELIAEKDQRNQKEIIENEWSNRINEIETDRRNDLERFRQEKEEMERKHGEEIERITRDYEARIATAVQEGNDEIGYKNKAFQEIEASRWDQFWGGLTTRVSDAVNAINGFIGQIRQSISGVAGEIGKLNPFSGSSSSLGGLFSPVRQKGAIYNEPGLAFLGEVEPEAIVPLSTLTHWIQMLITSRSVGNREQVIRPYIDNRTYKIDAVIRDETDIRKLARKLAEYQADEERAQGLS